jgi:hypothetical protein
VAADGQHSPSDWASCKIPQEPHVRSPHFSPICPSSEGSLGKASLFGAGSPPPACRQRSRRAIARYGSLPPETIRFFADLSPYELGRACYHLQPSRAQRSSSPISILKSVSTVMAQRDTIPCSPTVTTQQKIFESRREDQCLDTEQTWQIVRRKRWWRKAKRAANKSQPKVVLHRRKDLFRKFLAGKWFNCFASDHKAMSCRDPLDAGDAENMVTSLHHAP